MDELQKTVVVSGIEVTLDATILDDYEILEMLVDADSGDIPSAVKLTAVLFGKTQWKSIKAKLREQNNGRLPVMETMQFVKSVFDAVGKESHVEDAEKNLRI